MSLCLTASDVAPAPRLGTRLRRLLFSLPSAARDRRSEAPDVAVRPETPPFAAPHRRSSLGETNVLLL